jgi:hypothetical protein
VGTAAPVIANGVLNDDEEVSEGRFTLAYHGSTGRATEHQLFIHLVQSDYFVVSQWSLGLGWCENIPMASTFTRAARTAGFTVASLPLVSVSPGPNDLVLQSAWDDVMTPRVFCPQ